MPKYCAKADPRVKRAVGFLKKHPTLSILAAMKLADFELNEISCQAKYQWVYRELKKKGGSNLHTPFQPHIPVRSVVR